MILPHGVRMLMRSRSFLSIKIKLPLNLDTVRYFVSEQTSDQITLSSTVYISIYTHMHTQNKEVILIQKIYLKAFVLTDH